MKKVAIIKGTTIEYMSKELLFLAQSGQPYRGSVYVHFISQGETFDLIDFKRYITSLRTMKLSAENIAYEIYSTIEHHIQAEALGVVIDLSARGGIQQRLRFGHTFEPTQKENIFQI